MYIYLRDCSLHCVHTLVDGLGYMQFCSLAMHASFYKQTSRNQRFCIAIGMHVYLRDCSLHCYTPWSMVLVTGSYAVWLYTLGFISKLVGTNVVVSLYR